MNQINTQEIVGDIYEASYKPEHWNVVLEKIGILTQSDSCALLYNDIELERASGLYVWNFSQQVFSGYQQLKVDPNFLLFSERQPIGRAASAQQLLPDRNELEAFYGKKFNAFMSSHDIYYVAGVILFNDESRMVGIGLQRSKRSGPWPDEYIETLNELSPHIQRSLHIHKEFTRFKTREMALHSGLDRMVIGVLLIDSTYNCIYCNTIAEDIVNNANVLEIRNQQLIAKNKQDDLKLQKGINKAIQNKDTSDSDEAITSFGIWRKDRPLQLPMLICPAQGVWNQLHLQDTLAQAVILISNPEQNQPIVPEALSNTYGLTRTESKVAIAIANGYSLEEIAVIHGTKLTTTRTHLQAIFKKMNICRQTELVKALLTGPFRVNF